MKIIGKIRSFGMAIIISLSMMNSSCNFLDIVPPEQADIDDAVSSANNTLNFLYSCYSRMKSPQSPIATDEYVFPAGWGGNHRYVAYGLQTPSNTVDDARWRDYWAGINHTNLFLSKLPRAKGCTEAQIQQWTAEAYFLLAYYHYELLQYFGPIPIMEKYYDTNTSPMDFEGRMHYDYVVDWIVNTLDNKVINNPYMPAVRSSDENGRGTTVIAKALKARTLVYAASPLWNGSFPYPSWINKDVETPGYGKELVSTTYNSAKWTRAKAACEDAIESALNVGFKLYNNVDYVANIQTFITDDLLPYIPGLANPTSVEGKAFRRRVLMLRNMSTLKANEGNTEVVWGVNIDGGEMSYILPRAIVKLNSGAWSNASLGVGPTLNTVERFYTADGITPRDAAERNTFPPKSEWFDRAGISDAGRSDIIKLHVGREPRFYAWIAFDQGDYGTMIATGRPKKLEMKSGADAGQGYNTGSGSSNYSASGYLSQKWVRVDQRMNTTGDWSNSSVNRFKRPIFRMAELYLNLAECQAALNDNKALETLDGIRERAGVRKLTTADLTIMPLMDWVRNERFIELWSEGHRWNDVRRWAKGDEYFGPNRREGLNAIITNPTFEQFNTKMAINQPYKWYNKMYIAPIQYNETQRNPKLIQAPAY